MFCMKKNSFLLLCCFEIHLVLKWKAVLKILHVLNDFSFLISDFEHEYRLSEEFCRHHFLLGTLLQEIRASLCEVHEIRQTAICVFRNLLAKHAFDDRYQGKVNKLSAMYIVKYFITTFKLITILLIVVFFKRLLLWNWSLSNFCILFCTFQILDIYSSKKDNVKFSFEGIF